MAANKHRLIGPEPPDWFKGNGCGALGTGVLDWFIKRLGIDLSMCWRWHDWAYYKIRTNTADFTRLEADQWLAENITIDAADQEKPVRGALVRLLAYPTVRRLGKYTV